MAWSDIESLRKEALVAHRMYLYNLDGALDQPAPVLALMEWNYDFPTLLSPLLSAAPFLARNHCNDTGEADGIYAEAEGGKALMAAFYAFLERHAATLIDDLDAFREAKGKILALLAYRATGRYFHLDAWDVFNLSCESHPVQAAVLLERIRRDGERIRDAIEMDDPRLLDQCEGLAPEQMDSFRDLLNEPYYDFGWEALTSMIHDRAIVFESGGLKGLMSITGEVLAPARYQSIDDFGAWCDRAVVQREGLFGHIDTEGHETTAARYAHTFPYELGFAQVVMDGRVGLVDLDGIEVVACRYDELVRLQHFVATPHWAARRGERWGVVDGSGHACLVAEFSSVEAWSGTLFAVRPDKAVPEIYTERFAYLGEAGPEQVEAFELAGSEAAETFRYGLWREQPAGGRAVSILDAHGTNLFTAEVDDIEYLREMRRYRVCRQRRYGVIGFGGAPGAREAGWVVPPTYLALEPLRYHGEWFCYANGTHWGVIDDVGVERCAARYESLTALGRNYVWNDWLAIGFRKGLAFAVDADGQESPLSAEVAQRLLSTYGDDAFAQGQRDALRAGAGEASEAG